MKITVGERYRFDYLNPDTKAWEERDGVAEVASKQHQTLLIGGIIYYQNTLNPKVKGFDNKHIRNIETF